MAQEVLNKIQDKLSDSQLKISSDKKSYGVHTGRFLKYI